MIRNDRQFLLGRPHHLRIGSTGLYGLLGLRHRLSQRTIREVLVTATELKPRSKNAAELIAETEAWG
jgi:hypothetical protein